MAWFTNVAVSRTFASNDSQNAWVEFGGTWRRIKTGATDGVTNLFIMFNAAKANGRTVTVFVEDATNLVTIAYLN
ncbi:MAG TPA: peptidase M6 [Blastocatellia bacterium]|nr:peptidase M6 [Blastocatellia bacterium]